VDDFAVGEISFSYRLPFDGSWQTERLGEFGSMKVERVSNV